MRFRVLGCSGGQTPGHHLSSYLINRSLLVDAGSATSVLKLNEQQKIRNILITHVHLDHVASLATMADNLFSRTQTTIHVWGLREAVAGLRSSFFNDTLWPDFTRITSTLQPVPVLALHELPEQKPMRVGDCLVATVRVNHVVPSAAFFIGSHGKTLLHVGDTGPTEEVWTMARREKNLCAIVVEASFPNRLQELADSSRHLTPQTLERELHKMGRPSIPVLVAHVKPEYRREITAELKKLRRFSLSILKDGDVLNF